MRRTVIVLSAFAVLISGACGPKPKSPVSGADLVATAVAAHYTARVDGVVPREGGGYDWSVSALNGSDYSWKGTLTIKLVNARNEVIEGHDFPIAEMVPPLGKTSGLRFTSAHAPLERAGDVAQLKVEVNVTDYREPAAGK